MIEKTMYLIIAFNVILLVVLTAGVRSWQRSHGRLSEKKFALILTGFWTFFTITTFSPLFRINPKVAVIVDIILLLGFWGIGYPWTRWIYRQFTSANK